MTLHEASILATKYSSVIFLNRILPVRLRSVLISFSFIILLLAITVIAILEIEVRYHFLTPEYATLLEPVFEYRGIAGLVAVVSAFIFLFLYPLHLYSRYFLLGSIERVFGTNTRTFTVSYEAARVLLVLKKDGITNGLLAVPESHFIINRLLMSPQDIRSYTTTFSIDTDVTVPEYNGVVTLGSLWKLLYEDNDDIKKDLLSKKITKDIYYDTCDWLDRMLEDEKNVVRGGGEKISARPAVLESRCHMVALMSSVSLQES